MMVDDDDLSFLRLATHPSHEALLEVIATGPDPRLARGCDLTPRGRVFGQIGQLGAVAGLRALGPGDDAGELCATRVFSDETGLLETSKTDVVREPLHQRRM